MHTQSCAVLYLLHVLSYWLAVLVCSLIYRNQLRHISKCVRRVATNQLFGTPLLMPLLLWYQPPPHPATTTLSSWPEVVTCLLSCVLLTDLFFWHFHYAMHRFDALYSLHRAHHGLWNHPVAASALYAGLFEHVVVNSLPPVLAAVLSNATAPFMGAWIVAISVNVVVSHAQPEGQHALHHERHDCNFGVGFMLTDRLYGTFRARA